MWHGYVLLLESLAVEISLAHDAEKVVLVDFTVTVTISLVNHLLYGMAWHGMVWYGMVWYGSFIDPPVAPRRSSFHQAHSPLA